MPVEALSWIIPSGLALLNLYMVLMTRNAVLDSERRVLRQFNEHLRDYHRHEQGRGNHD